MSREDQYFHSKKNFAFDYNIEMDFGTFEEHQKRGNLFNINLIFPIFSVFVENSPFFSSKIAQ
jgi:hypothetical protein